jgi:hypothetical protein
LRRLALRADREILYILNMDVLNGSLRTRRPDAAKIALQSAGSAEG